MSPHPTLRVLVAQLTELQEVLDGIEFTDGGEGFWRQRRLGLAAI